VNAARDPILDRDAAFTASFAVNAPWCRENVRGAALTGRRPGAPSMLPLTFVAGRA
jgi:hypothetical protein